MKTHTSAPWIVSKNTSWSEKSKTILGEKEGFVIFSRYTKKTCKRVFMSLEFGLINYLLSEVFVKKWEEHVKNEQLSTEMEMLKLVVDQQNSDLEGQQKEAQDLLRQIDELQTGSYADAREMERLRAEIEALKEELKIKETKLTRKKERVNIGQ